LAGSDKDRRTEPPTPRRIKKARKEGETAKSQVLSRGIVMLAVALIFLPLISYSAGRLVVMAGRLFQASTHSTDTRAIEALHFAATAAKNITWPWFVSALFAAVIIAFAQVGPLFAPKVVLPKLSRISPASGMRKMFSLRNMALVGLTAFAAVVIGVATGIELKQALYDLAGTAGGSIESGLAKAGDHARTMYLSGALILVAVGVIDYLIARKEHWRNLFMTPEEAKKEYKEQEGDPEIRARRRDIHRELSERMGPGAVEDGNLLVTGKGRLAILQYRQGRDAAPVVLLSATGEEALRLLAIARAMDKMIVRDPKLVDELSRCGDGEYITEDLYDPVAVLYRQLFGNQKDS